MARCAGRADLGRQLAGAMVLMGVAAAPAWGHDVPASAPATDAAGPRIRVSDIHDPRDRDAGGEATLAIVGARNGAFSGKVVLDSPAPIVGLKASASDLRQGEAVIPASAVRLRYGAPWGDSFGRRMRDWGADVLLDRPPEEAPIGDGNRASAPIWVTVRVPTEVPAGTYSGRLTVEASGIPPVQLPVRLEVADSALPDPQDYRTWCEIIQSPDTLAMEYGAPLWSARHWERIARSLDLIAPTGSRVVHVPLIARTNLGNEQSMVRWVRRPAASGAEANVSLYDFDVSVMEKYLDLAQKHLGRPKIVIFWAWDIALKPETRDIRLDANTPQILHAQVAAAEARHALADKGPAVTVWDASAGKAETVRLPRYEDPAGRALWAPLWAELHKRMKARGLEKEMMLGMVADQWPSKAEVTALKDLSGDLPWATCSHAAPWLARGGATGRAVLQEVGTVGYAVTKLQRQYVVNPARGRSYGWRSPILHAAYRLGWPTPTLVSVRQEAECNITGAQRGLGHLGGDFWPVVRGRDGARVGMAADRFPESFWRSLNLGTGLLAPGPDGALGTSRLEVLREGLQECEARIAIEGVLVDDALKGKIGAELAARAQAILDERHRCLWLARGAKEADLEREGLLADYKAFDYGVARNWDAGAGLKWYLASGWQERSRRLFAVAGEVKRRAAANERDR